MLTNEDLLREELESDGHDLDIKPESIPGRRRPRRHPPTVALAYGVPRMLFGNKDTFAQPARVPLPAMTDQGSRGH